MVAVDTRRIVEPHFTWPRHALTNSGVKFIMAWALSEDVDNMELAFLGNYHIFRKDSRLQTRGGGDMIAVKSTPSCDHLTINYKLEVLWDCVKLAWPFFNIGLCYWPPTFSRHFCDLSSECPNGIFNRHPRSLIVLGGDFNYPGVNCSECSICPGCRDSSECREFCLPLNLATLLRWSPILRVVILSSSFSFHLSLTVFPLATF